ncbi:hypothetical protein [uncultured Deefgea sp.]|uniref:hypothetical protein n=1 Tax=uncultured Deefgea sp. TaxID=1304914 RepID=UPI002593DC46|nr:hypothetical protein [uncultured Deefgea sp.]
MNKVILGILFSSLTVGAYAATEKEAERLVKKYSETVACQLEETKYTAVKVESESVNGLGDIFLVHWDGDIGCGGGNGTVLSNFSMVSQRTPQGGRALIVDGEAVLPEMDIRYVQNLSIKNGVISIKGVAWADNPKSQADITKPVSYKLKYVSDDGKFIKVK